MFDNDVWLQQVREDIVDPGREIVDPHHHLWEIATLPYNLEQLLADTASGHNVVQTVFMECSASYFEMDQTICVRWARRSLWRRQQNAPRRLMGRPRSQV